MSGEKTEKATARKRREARKKGQILKSTEVNTTFCCVVMFSMLIIIWPWFSNKIREIFGQYLSAQAIVEISEQATEFTFTGIFTRVIQSMLGAMLPILATALIAGVGINVFQTGFMFTTETMKFKLDKLNPLSGFKRMFSITTVVELVKSILKIILLVFVIYRDYIDFISSIAAIMKQDPYQSFLFIFDTALKMALKMSVVMIAIAAGDYLYQWWKYEKDLKMTKQEVKDEHKNIEGDPKVKAKIKSKQRQMSVMRMMSNVPEADVVITNPTHYAVALKYDEKNSSAPVVVAKGQDYLARKIKDVARENKVTIIENKPLAQALYAMCEVNDQIPAEFYQAVADILVFIFRQKNSGKKYK